jgi:arginase
MIERHYTIIEAPSILGLRSTGVDRLGPTLLKHGLQQRLHARHAGRVEPAVRSGQRDKTTMTLNAEEIASWTPRLADAVEPLLDRREFPLVLGGDCTILLGTMLALRRRGRYGLLFVDAHADFYQPEANPNGEAASMELGFATGYGPPLLTDFEGRRPLVRADDTVAFGIRDEEEQQNYGSRPLAPEILALDLTTIRRMGTEKAMAIALEHLSRPALDGFFVHLDADSLHDSIMPAVDYRLTDGLTWDEMASILGLAIGHDGAVGMEITIYNPASIRTGGRGVSSPPRSSRRSLPPAPDGHEQHHRAQARRHD